MTSKAPSSSTTNNIYNTKFINWQDHSDKALRVAAVISRPGSVKHLKKKIYTERLILAAVKDTEDEIRKVKNVSNKNLPDISVNRNIGQIFCYIHFLLYVFRLLYLSLTAVRISRFNNIYLVL